MSLENQESNEEKQTIETPSSETQETMKPKMQEAENKSCKHNLHKGLVLLNIILLIGLVVMYILFFTSKPSCSKPAKQGMTTAGGTNSNLAIGYIDTDSLMSQYEYALELNKKVEYYAHMEADYKDRAMKFQNDYNNYLKTGASLTLTEQKRTEESLKKRAEDIAKLEERLVGERSKIESIMQTEQKKMIDAVYAFIREYNANNQQFDVILKKSFSESPVLYIDSSMDITREVIDGLNKEYKNVKGK